MCQNENENGSVNQVIQVIQVIQVSTWSPTF